jgi:tetratricopeptide (TPR) repeat protein
MQDRLRALWDFSDLDASEARLREQLEAERDDAGRAEVLTQLARVQGLRGDFDDADRLLDDGAALGAGSREAEMRISLERGRVRRSSGDSAAAFPFFEAAFEVATAAEQWFVAADAAHMAALAAPDRETHDAWVERGLELATEHESARHWLGSILNNLGWERYEAGEHEAALDAFERALAAREEAGDWAAVQHARYAVAKALGALGRHEEAISHLELAVAWAGSEGEPDGWFHEELALAYAAAGRPADARTQAALALPLLRDADPSFAADLERASRLEALARG